MCVWGEVGRGKSCAWATNFKHCDLISNGAVAMRNKGLEVISKQFVLRVTSEMIGIKNNLQEWLLISWALKQLSQCTKYECVPCDKYMPFAFVPPNTCHFPTTIEKIEISILLKLAPRLLCYCTNFLSLRCFRRDVILKVPVYT